MNLAFAHDWQAEILTVPPLIAPARQFVYPQRVPGEEEAISRGAFLLKVRPAAGGDFLATCALGFTDPAMPTGIWASPNPKELCAVAGGYAYLIDTSHPETSVFVRSRPVVAVHALEAQGMLLFQGFHTLLAWGAAGLLWETAKLSWEGLRVTDIRKNEAHGFGWDLMADKEVAFTVDLRSGKHTGGGFRQGP